MLDFFVGLWLGGAVVSFVLGLWFGDIWPSPNKSLREVALTALCVICWPCVGAYLLWRE